MQPATITNAWVSAFKVELGIEDKDRLPSSLSEEQKGASIRILSKNFNGAMKLIASFSAQAGNGLENTAAVAVGSELGAALSGEGMELLNLTYHNCTRPMVVFQLQGRNLLFWSPRAVEIKRFGLEEERRKPVQHFFSGVFLKS